MTWTANAGQADRIFKQLDDNGGFATITLRDLKALMNVDRLGKIVLQDTRVWLHRNGIGYFPKWILDENDEPRQGQELRLYRTDRASALARVVSAVLDPSEMGDKALSDLLKDSATQRVEELEERLERTRAALEDALTEINRAAE